MSTAFRLGALEVRGLVATARANVFDELAAAARVCSLPEVGGQYCRNM